MIALRLAYLTGMSCLVLLQCGNLRRSRLKHLFCAVGLLPSVDRKIFLILIANNVSACEPSYYPNNPPFIANNHIENINDPI